VDQQVTITLLDNDYTRHNDTQSLIIVIVVVVQDFSPLRICNGARRGFGA
ncbi:MAG: hypothetical protein ACI90V_010193, partial [Bacillariaceae sp.]|jgi:hypothetical protein